MTSRKKSGVAFWTTVVVVVGLSYPLSAGPFDLLYRALGRPHLLYSFSWIFYGPLLWILERSDGLREVFVAYMRCWGGP